MTIAATRLLKVKIIETRIGVIRNSASVAPVIRFIFSAAKVIGLKRATAGKPPSKSMNTITTAVRIKPPKLPDATVEDNKIKARTMQPNIQRQVSDRNR